MINQSLTAAKEREKNLLCSKQKVKDQRLSKIAAKLFSREVVRKPPSIAVKANFHIWICAIFAAEVAYLANICNHSVKFVSLAHTHKGPIFWGESLQERACIQEW